MASKYDGFWEDRVAEIARLLDQAYRDGTSSEIDVSGLREYGAMRNWRGSFVIRPNGTTGSSSACCRSLGHVLLARGAMERYRGLGFRFTDDGLVERAPAPGFRVSISRDLKLSVGRVDSGEGDRAGRTLEDAFARIEELERRVAALERRILAQET